MFFFFRNIETLPRSDGIIKDLLHFLVQKVCYKRSGPCEFEGVKDKEIVWRFGKLVKESVMYVY